MASRARASKPRQKFRVRRASLAGRSPEMAAYFERMLKAGWVTRSQIPNIPGALHPDTYRARLREYREATGGRLPAWATEAEDGTILYNVAHIMNPASGSRQHVGTTQEAARFIEAQRRRGFVRLSEIAGAVPNTEYVRIRAFADRHGVYPSGVIRAPDGTLLIMQTQVGREFAPPKTVAKRPPAKRPKH